MKTLLTIVILCLVATLGAAQSPNNSEPDKKPRELHGKVTKVNTATKSLTVDHEAVPGWMDAMTMSYPVDEETVLTTVKAGDRITATVYIGDLTLHNIHVVKGKTRNH